MKSSRSLLHISAVFSALVLAAGIVHAQDPGMDAAMQANQQAMMAAQQANQQAIQDMQLATQQTMNALQPESWWGQTTAHPGINTRMLNGARRTDAPQLSKTTGVYSSPVTVRLKDHKQGAAIYYTTDGWTPTRLSARYTGPITITSTTTLQAVAIAPNFARSVVSFATYIFRTNPPAVPATLPVQSGADGTFVLTSEAHIPLVFTQPLDSGTAKAGDPVAFTLAEDLKAGDAVVIPKGTQALGTVVRAVRVQPGVEAGRIGVEVDSLIVGGREIPLQRLAVLEGRIDPTAQDARITAGTAVTAVMTAGTTLPGSPR
jgi:hypothetical protein